MVVNAIQRAAGSAADADAPGRNEFAGSFAKGLAVLEHMAERGRPATLTDLSVATGQSRASVRRFALTLVHLGLAEHNDGAFSLRANALRIDARSRELVILTESAEPFMRQLVDRFREASAFGRHDGLGIEILVYQRCDRLMSLNLMPGSRLPLTTSAQGRILLSHMAESQVNSLPGVVEGTDRLRTALDEARKLGYAFVDQELEKGVRSIALGVRGPQSKQVIASMSLCAHSNRISAKEMIEEGVPALRAAVRATEAAAQMRIRAAS